MDIYLGERLALIAMKKELAILADKADKAEKLAKDRINVATNIFKVRKQALELMESDLPQEEKTEKLKTLAFQEKKLFALSKRDFKAINKLEYETAQYRDALSMEIDRWDKRQAIRGI